MRVTSLSCAVWLVLSACVKPTIAPGAPDAGAGSSAAESDEVRPVYAGRTAPDVRAQKLCGLLYAVPAEKQASCCGTKPQPTVTEECTRIVSLALGGGKVTLDDSKLAACEVAVQADQATCDRAGNLGDPIPDACQGLFAGTLAPGAVCRSALECGPDLTCVGLGPTDPGKCVARAGAGSPCHPLVDPLAVYARQSLVGHEPCDGYCDRSRCADVVPVGRACTFQDQCGAVNHCDGHRCAPGRTLALGERCSQGDACPAGASCLDGVCAKRGGIGAPCARDDECLGACVVGDGGRHCGPRCPQPFRLPSPANVRRPLPKR